MATKTFVEKIMSFIKSGDEGKLNRFSSKLDKYIAKQIAMRKEQIDTLNEKQLDAADVLADSVLNVNMDKIQSTEDIEEYCVEYSQEVLSKLDVSDDIAEEIADLEAQIARLENLQTTIAGVEAKVETSK